MADDNRNGGAVCCYDAPMFDWGDGTYELTASVLVQAAERAAQAGDIQPGMLVLDLGCGTGNAAIAAARCGAVVTGVDPAERLLEVARQRAVEERLSIAFSRGDAGDIPARDGSFDLVLSVFAVIFAPDAQRAAAEMVRVLRPGGRIVMTSWVDAGALAMAGKLLRQALLPVLPGPGPRAQGWSDPGFIRALFEQHGAAVEIAESTLSFTADSPAACFAEFEEHHPVWRAGRRMLAGRPGEWEALRAQTVDALAAASEDASAFRVTSRYYLTRADLPG
jgi:ubiquinone/menaquinone biosynthesis C-methylase UbiE